MSDELTESTPERIEKIERNPDNGMIRITTANGVLLADPYAFRVHAEGRLPADFPTDEDVEAAVG